MADAAACGSGTTLWLQNCTLGHREDVGEGADEGESWAGPTWPLGPGNLLGVEKTLGKHFEFL